MTGWFGPQSGDCDCCGNGCDNCIHGDTNNTPLTGLNPDGSLPNGSPISPSFNVPSADWIADFFFDDFGDGNIEIVVGPITIKIVRLTNVFGDPYWEVKNIDDQHPEGEGCEGVFIIDPPSATWPAVIRASYGTSAATRNETCPTSVVEVYRTIKVFSTILSGDPCGGYAGDGGKCYGAVYETAPTGVSIDVTSQGSGAVLSRIRVLQQDPTEVSCIEANDCGPCVIASGFDVIHWSNYQVSISGLPAVYEEHWRETDGWLECHYNGVDGCESWYQFDNRKVSGMDAINGTYAAKLVDLLDPTYSAILPGDEPAGLLDSGFSRCRDQRYAWLLEVPVVPAARVYRDIDTFGGCGGAPSSTVDNAWADVGYLRFGFYGAAPIVMFFRVMQITGDFDTLVANAKDETWVDIDDPDKVFTTQTPDMEILPFKYAPFSALEGTPYDFNGAIPPGVSDPQVEDVVPTRLWMPVISTAASGVPPATSFPDASGGQKSFDLGRCDGVEATILDVPWFDATGGRSYPGRNESSTLTNNETRSRCFGKITNKTITSESYNLSISRTATFTREGC